uniref:Uncharacterized protein n=1 Tax=Chlorocebus sabaeus TaxID=60711 RepID=A0A0D9RPT2_CHLSB
IEVTTSPRPAQALCCPPRTATEGVLVPKEWLTEGNNSQGGISDRLLIDSQPDSRKNSTLQPVQIQRSPSVDQGQTFLPQMAQAHEKLRKPGCFNIENIDGLLRKVIQMDVALFEMNQSDSKVDSSESEDEDDSIPCEVTIDNIKLPNSEDGKGKTEVLDSLASKNKN